MLDNPSESRISYNWHWVGNQRVSYSMFWERIGFMMEMLRPEEEKRKICRQAYRDYNLWKLRRDPQK